MLELIFQGFLEWTYGLILQCWEYFSSVLMNIMSMDFAYLKVRMPVIVPIMQVMLGLGWALLIGNLVFQATRSMMAGLGFEAEDPKLLFTRTFVFAFLLLASPQICDIALNMTSRAIAILEVPSAVDIKFADEASFGGMAVSWLLVIICGIVVMFQSFKLIFEMAERYFILAVLTITSPLAFGMGGSRSTSDIFSGWCRMYGSMCLLTVLNVVFVKMLLSVLSFYPSGLDVLPWMVLVLTVVKVAKKTDAIITRIGLNPAMTGDSLGRFPGALTYMVARGLTNNVMSSFGKGQGGTSPRRNPGTPPTGPTTPRTDAPSGGRMSATSHTSSTQNSSAQQTNTAQSGGPQTSVNEAAAGIGTNNGGIGVNNSPTTDTRRTSVPFGMRRAPSHVKSTSPVPPLGTRGTRPDSSIGTAAVPPNAPAVHNGAAGRAGAVSSERMMQNADHSIQTGGSGTPATGNRGTSQPQQASGSSRYTHRDGGNRQQSGGMNHGGAGTGTQVSEQSNVSVGGARVSSSVSGGKPGAVQQPAGESRYSDRESRPAAARPATAPQPVGSDHGAAGTRPGHAGQPDRTPQRGRNSAPSATAAPIKGQQPITAQQESRQPRQVKQQKGAPMYALHHGAAGIAPNAARAANMRMTAEQSATRATSRGKETPAERIEPETVSEATGGDEDRRSEK